jgi:uncharacterized cofD-like protein
MSEYRGGPRVVAFGGGHGLSASLTALRTLTDSLTAVVTVADDGGSSGVLRSELGALPPGDLRMALAALAGEQAEAQRWACLSQHRFGGGGTLAGHPVGNLMLTGLIELGSSPVEALDALGGLLGTVGRVLPLSPRALDIVATVVGLDPDDPGAAREVRGQVAVATTSGDVVGVRVEPDDAPACHEAVEAVMAADWVVLGPGSWFTSVLPHVLVPEMAKALAATPARILLALNLAPQHGETEGFSAANHLEVFGAHAPGVGVDVVLADAATTGLDDLPDIAGELGATLVTADVADPAVAAAHDPLRLAAAYASILVPTEGRPEWP